MAWATTCSRSARSIPAHMAAIWFISRVPCSPSAPKSRYGSWTTMPRASVGAEMRPERRMGTESAKVVEVARTVLSRSK